MKTLAIGCDSCGLELKETLKKHLLDKGYEVTDYGVEEAESDIIYYSIANKVSKSICDGHHEKAVLICGTGMGMSIIANKHPGIYASVCESPLAASHARSINNSNILTLGSMLTTGIVAKEILDAWLSTSFTEGWDQEEQEWLRDSMDGISKLEHNLFN